MLRNAVPELGSTSVADGISRRLTLYRNASGELPAALINIGGSHVIFGNRGHQAPLRQGLTTGYRPTPAPADSLAAPFLRANRPVIHFINVRRLAAKYQISDQTPPGSATVFRRQTLPSVRAIPGHRQSGNCHVYTLAHRERWVLATSATKINWQLTCIGFGLTVLSLLAPLVIGVKQFNILPLMESSILHNSTGMLLVASLRLVVLNTLRALPLYTGVLLAAEGFGLFRQQPFPGTCFTADFLYPGCI